MCNHLSASKKGERWKDLAQIQMQLERKDHPHSAGQAVLDRTSPLNSDGVNEMDKTFPLNLSWSNWRESNLHSVGMARIGEDISSKFSQGYQIEEKGPS